MAYVAVASIDLIAHIINIMRNPFYENSFQSKERIGWAPIFNTAQLPESRGLVVLE